MLRTILNASAEWHGRRCQNVARKNAFPPKYCTVNILVHTVQYLLFTVQCTIVQMAKGSKHLFQKSASYVGDMPRFLTQLQYDPLSGPDKRCPNNNQNLRIKTGSERILNDIFMCMQTEVHQTQTNIVASAPPSVTGSVLMQKFRFLETFATTSNDTPLGQCHEFFNHLFFFCFKLTTLLLFF